MFRIISKLHGKITQCLVFLQKTKFCEHQQKAPWKWMLNFSRCVLFHMKTCVFLKYFVRACLLKQLFALNSPQIPSNLICLTISVTLRYLTQFLAIGTVNKDIKCKITFCRLFPEPVFCFQLTPDPFKFNLFGNFSNSKVFNTVLTSNQSN